MRPDPSPLVSAILAALLMGPALAADGEPPALDGDAATPSLASEPARRVEVQANTHTASSQETAALARDAAGRTVVVWQSKRQEGDGSYGVYARRFDALGRPLGGELHVNLNEAGAQVRPAVALAPSGAAWFAWESHGQDGDRGAVLVRRFDAELSESTNEILVDDVHGGHQGMPAVAVDAEGRALVVWTGPAQGSARVVRARLFAADGTPLGDPISLGGEDGAIDNLPTVVAEATGGFALAWARTDLEGRPSGIVARRLDGEGAVRGGELALAEGNCIEPALASNARGDLLAAWMWAGEVDWAPQVRLVRGSELEPVRTLEGGSPGHASGCDVALRDDGTALVVWSRFGDEGKRAGLFARELDADLAPSAAFRLTGAARGHQRLGVGGARRAIVDRDGTLACAWDGAGAGGDSQGAHLTLLVPASIEEGALLARSAPDDPVDLQPEGAEPHEPPVFTGRESDRGALVGLESASGPDYGFLGIPETSLTPPDPHVAVGPNHVVAIVNARMSFFTKDGTQTFSVPTDGPNGFWAGVGQAATGFIFDPEVLYDPHADRFMAMLNERNGNGYFLFAVSDDSDPNGAWHKYRFDATAAIGDTDIDSPNMAVDDQVVYLAADFFGPDKYLVYMVEKAPLLSGQQNPIITSLVITGDQSIGLPVTYDAGAPAQYMIEAFEAFQNTQVRLHAITDPLGTPQRVTVDVNVPMYEQPEDPPQLGTSVRPQTFESRFWSCMFRGGSLWATHHVDNTQVRQRWYEFQMNGWPAGGTPTLRQWGEVPGGKTGRSYFGSVWADEDGNAGLVFATSSPAQFIAMARSYRQATDPLGTMTAPVVMQSSTEPDTSGRWGDYSGVASDPNGPGAFWGHHEYRSGGMWMTWVGLMGPCKTPIPYCTAKTTSIGTTPSIGWTGEPSVQRNAFSVTMTNGLPGKNGVAFWGLTPGAIPFFGGTKCVLAPTKRTPIFAFDGSGATTLPISLTLGDLAQTRYYQFWFRDPTHPDGTTVGLSNALEFTICP